MGAAGMGSCDGNGGKVGSGGAAGGMASNVGGNAVGLNFGTAMFDWRSTSATCVRGYREM